MYIHRCHGMQLEVRGPLVGICSLIPLYGSLELNSDCQCWSPVPVYQDPLCWPTNTFDNCMLSLFQVQLIWGIVFRRHSSLLTCKSCQGFLPVKHTSTLMGTCFCITRLHSSSTAWFLLMYS